MEGAKLIENLRMTTRMWEIKAVFLVSVKCTLNMRNRLALLILLVALAVKVKGQSDTYFVLPPLYEWQAGDHDIFLYISTSAPNASVWIYNSDTSYSQTINVTSNSVGTVSLTTPVPGLLSTYGARELNWSNSKLHDERHVQIGIDSLKQLMNNGETIRHLVF